MLDKERVFEFLLGLNKELDEVKGCVLNYKLFLEIKQVFAEVRRDEAQQRVMLRRKKNPIL